MKLGKESRNDEKGMIKIRKQTCESNGGVKEKDFVKLKRFKKVRSESDEIKNCEILMMETGSKLDNYISRCLVGIEKHVCF